MTINDKIKQILIERNFTPSYFADEIGVQRSSISHILSGRNRPSFDIIQKIIRRFPELGYEWIMEEDNSYAQPQPSANRYNGQPATQVTTIPMKKQEPEQRQPATSNGPFRTTRQEIQPDTELNDDLSITPTRKVERILMFYSDGSFQEYLPV